MAKIRVKIVERDGEFIVDPPSAFLTYDVLPGKNDKLKLFNTTNEDLVFRLESALPFGAAVVEVIKAGASSFKDVHANAVDGQYPYQILMLKSGKKAKGNSDPQIIIDN